jgi:lantibiotic transport system permease protein
MIVRALHTEFLKLKKICYIIPVLSSFIFIIFTCLEWYLYFRHDPMGVYSIFNVMYLFLSFIMVLSITLLTSIIASTEHEALGWKLIHSLSIPSSILYISKILLVILLMLGTCILIIAELSIVWVLYTDETLPFLFLTKQVFYCFFASFPILTIQLYISIRFYNQSFALVTGICGTIASLFLGRSTVEWIHYLPWSYPSLATPFFENGINWVLTGIGIGLLFLLFSIWRYKKIEF